MPERKESLQSPTREELRAEIDDLRRQVQFLRRTLVVRERWRERLRRTARVAAGRARARLRRSRDYHPEFRPYRPRIPTQTGNTSCRILHAIANVETGGSARLIVDLAEHLPQSFQHQIITRARPLVRGYVGLEPRPFPHLTSSKQIRSVIRRFDPDIVHVHYVADDPRTSSGEGDWQWYRHVFTAAEEEGRCVVENVNIPVPPYVSDAVRRYVYVSAHVAERFRRDGEPSTVIYPGSDTHFFTKKRGVDPPDDSIGMVYRLQPDKLGANAIDPFVEVLQKRSGTRALIIGGGRLLPVYRGAVERAGLVDAVEFPGFVAYDDLPDWYLRMAVFLAPVVRESFGQVVPFAMSMGLPVVGYAVGALPEIVGDEELLVPAGDSSGLADLVAQLLDDRERRLEIGRRNRERAVERFALPAMIEKYAALYEELAGAGTVNRGHARYAGK